MRPIARNDRPKELPKRLTREEVAALLAQPNRRYPTGIRDRALLRVMYRAGLRCAEALALEPRDVQLSRNEIKVVRGKGGKDRVLWVDEATVEMLARWKDVRPASPFFFCTLKGRELRSRDVREMVARRGRKAGVEIPVHPHLLRHTFASEMLEDGCSEAELQKALGHASADMTRRYTHVADARLRAFMISRPG